MVGMASVMWAVTASMYDVQALCRLLHPLTLTLTIIKVQYTARNPNLTAVTATCRIFWRVAATVLGLGVRALYLAPFYG